MNLERTVINNIRRIRKEKGISQEKLAELCDTATSYIGRLEIYGAEPRLSTIERIAEALNVPAIELFRDDTENKTDNQAEKSKTLAAHLKREIISSMEKELDEILKRL